MTENQKKINRTLNNPVSIARKKEQLNRLSDILNGGELNYISQQNAGIFDVSQPQNPNDYIEAVAYLQGIVKATLELTDITRQDIDELSIPLDLINGHINTRSNTEIIAG